MILLLWAAFGASAAEPRFLFLSPHEAAAIKAAVKAGDAWTVSPARELRTEADRASARGPWSVTANRPARVRIDPHDYYSEATYHWPDPANPSGPYVRHDGKANPGRFLGNKSAMSDMSDAVFSLGLAAWLFDEPRYAGRAALVLRTWFLDAATRMNPHLEHGQAIPNVNTGRGTGIIDTRPLIHCAAGAQFLEAAGRWTGADRDGLRRWFADYVRWLTTSQKGMAERDAKNNHGSWWAAQVAAFATYAGDEPARETAWNRYRTLLASGIRPDGSAPLEEARTKSLSYSLFNVEAHAVLCRMAQIAGLDLWHYQTASGVTLQTAIEYLLPYLRAPAEWKKPQIAPAGTGRAAWLVFAGLGFGRSGYIETYKRMEAPGGSWLALVDLIAGYAAARPRDQE